MIIPNILALDFDGVLCDGMQEYSEANRRSYMRVWPDETVPGEDLFPVFRTLRRVITTGWEMPLLLRGIAQGRQHRQFSGTGRRCVRGDGRIRLLELDQFRGGLTTWISRYHPAGVYDGEEGKRADYTASLPPFLLQKTLLSHLSKGRQAVILAEEWHTMDAVLHIDWLLRRAGVRSQVTILWHANHTFACDRIPWGRLAEAAIITTLSRYMIVPL
jgi:hypothetical protein